MRNADPASRRNAHAPRHRSGLGRRLTAEVAAHVLALVTGLPLRSAHAFLPDPEDRDMPYLGI